MKIAVVGSGAMGQLFGARLALGGNDVSFVDANPQVVERLNATASRSTSVQVPRVSWHRRPRRPMPAGLLISS